MKKRNVKLIVIGAALSALLGCGSGSNNDQGTGLNLFGFFFIDTSGKIDCTTRTSGSSTALSTGTETGGITDVVTALGAENFLDGQGVTVSRAQIQYVISGASSQPPDTSVPVGFVLAPTTNDVGSSLPPGFKGSGGGTGSGISNIECRAFAVVPSSILEWMNLNRASIPEPPFILEAFVTLRGTTTSGHVIDSNTLSYPVFVQPDNTITPTTNPTGASGSSSSANSTSSGPQLSDQPLNQ
jgi:hypothetical protein